MDRLKFIATRLIVVICMLVLIVLSAVPGWSGSQTVSSTLASAIITEARSYLNEPTAAFWTDAEMLIWVNDGSMDIVTRTHCLEDVETETLVSAQTAYPLADPFIIIKYVIYNDEKALKRGNIEDFGHTLADVSGDPLGEPVYWAEWENNIIVYPAPNATASGNDIDVYVVDRPAVVASAVAVLIPTQYDKALVYYVAGQAWAKDGQMERAKAYMTLYLQELDRFRMDISAQPATPEDE